MSKTSAALLAALTLAALTLAAPLAHAEGRFGKKDAGDAASAPSDGAAEGPSPQGCASGCGGGSNPLASFLLAWGASLHGHDLAVAPVPLAPRGEPVVVHSLTEAAEEVGHTLAATHGRPANPVFALRADGLALREGAGLQLGVGTEGRRWGLLANATGLWLAPEGGGPGTDRLQQVQLHATFSPYAHQSLRLRLEAGPDYVRAPDAQFLGLGLGASLEGCVLGALDGELRLSSTVLPYTDVDARAGLSLRLAAVSLRMGLRLAYLNDRGLTQPGDPHSDTLFGPYFGLGLSL